MAPPPSLSTATKLLERGRLKLVLSVLVLELAIFFAAMVVPIDQATRSALLGQVNTLSGEAKNLSSLQVFSFIATHNAKIALLEFLPVVGTFLWIITIYATGLAIQIIAVPYGMPGIVAGYALFLFPFAIMELCAYAVAVSSGVMLLVSWQRKRLRQEARVLVLEVGVVLALLVIAAAMEAATIASPLFGFTLWVPILAGVIVVVKKTGVRF